MAEVDLPAVDAQRPARGPPRAREHAEQLLPQGDSCRYSVTVRNNTDAPLDGLAWSVVDGFELSSGLTFTRFEASVVRGSRQAVRALIALEPLAEQVLQFRFDVPTAALGATFCTEIYLGVDPDPP